MTSWGMPDCSVPPPALAPAEQGQPLALCCLGEGCLGIALRAAHHGNSVVLAVQDGTDAQRLAEICAKVDGLTVQTALADGICLVAEDWAGPVPPDALRLGFDIALIGEVAEMRAPRGAQLARALNLHVVQTGGGVALAMLGALENAAEDLILSGAVPWELDEALEMAGFTESVFVRQDKEGVDTALARSATAGPVPRRMVMEGRLGRKVGVGWYRYPGNAGRVVDPLIEDLVREEAWFAKHPQRSIEDGEIVARLATAVMQAAVKANEAGADARAIDVLAVGALGYPPFWGGPLHHLRHAPQNDLDAVLTRCGIGNLAARFKACETSATGPIS